MTEQDSKTVNISSFPEKLQCIHLQLNHVTMFFNVPTEFSVFLGERARSMNLFRFTAQCALRGNHLLFSCFLHE